MSIKPITASKHNTVVPDGTIVSKSVTSLRNSSNEQTQNLRRQQMIEITASDYAKQRGIVSGYEVQDWLKAEAVIDDISQ